MTETSEETGDVSPHQFDIMEWIPAYTNCQKYFLDNAQYDAGVQAAAAFTNIRLPHQWRNPVFSSGSTPPSYTSPNQPQASQTASTTASQPQEPSRLGSSGSSVGHVPSFISLYPYVRRLVVTGFDRTAILQGFFGDDWRKGVGPLHQSERRNYMFIAKSGGWAKVKEHYDVSPEETVPFLQPLQSVTLKEIENGEREWSRWLAMEDWMVGPRAPSAASVAMESSGAGDDDMEDTREGQEQ